MSSKLLLEILQLPTAPLHEDAVIHYVRGFAGTHGLSCAVDRFGNLYLTNHPGTTPRCIVSAHMDHPGARVTAVRGRTATLKILGGLNKQFLPRARWRMCTAGGAWIAARTTKTIDEKNYTIACDAAPGVNNWFVLDLPRAAIRNGRVSASAIDNLAGTAAVLDWLAAHRASRTPLLGVLTRAEEIGFAGAAAVVRAQRAPKHIPWIVLEASNAKVACVTMGGGPVVRVGDRLTTFHPHMDLWLQEAARRTAAQHKDFRWQRALMTGGRMEASLYMLNGYCVGSLVVPLGNYHNSGPRGFAPEYTMLNDWINLRRMLDMATMMPPPEKIAKTYHRKLQQEIAENLKKARQE